MKSENKRLEDENNRQNRRISALEEAVHQIGALTTSVEKLAMSVESMAKEMEGQSSWLKTLEGRDGEKWRQATGYVLTVIIGIVLGAVATHIG